MNPYAVPQYAEKEEAHRAMLALDRLQQAVLRSYVMQVHFGGMKLADWYGTDFAVARQNWQKPARKGGRYYGTEDDGNPLFRAALEKLIDCYARARTDEEEREVAAGAREYRMNAGGAARTHVFLMQHAADERVRLNAASEVADRAGLGKVQKVDMTSKGNEVRSYTVLAHPGMWDEEEAE